MAKKGHQKFWASKWKHFHKKVIQKSWSPQTRRQVSATVCEGPPAVMFPVGQRCTTFLGQGLQHIIFSAREGW